MKIVNMIGRTVKIRRPVTGIMSIVTWKRSSRNIDISSIKLIGFLPSALIPCDLNALFVFVIYTAKNAIETSTVITKNRRTLLESSSESRLVIVFAPKIGSTS